MKHFTVFRPRLRVFQWVRGYVAFEGEGSDEEGFPPESVVLALGNRRLDCVRLDPLRTGRDRVRFRRFFRTGKGPKWVTARVRWRDGSETIEGRFLAMNLSRRPPDPFVRDYRHFLSRNAPSRQEIGELGKAVETLGNLPKISVLLPVFNTDPGLLRAAVDSVRGQVYPHWELCIADDASSRRSTRRTLRRLAGSDERIRVVYRKENGHISRASNTALEAASGEWVALLDHDDALAPHSLARLVLEMNRHPDARFLYSDEDKIDPAGRPLAPYFKPDWNPILLFSQNYVCHLACARTDDVRSVGGFREGFEGSQDWDLFLRLGRSLRASEIRHIPEVLYHWRVVPGSSAGSVAEKGYSVRAARKALGEAVPWAAEGEWRLEGNMYWVCEPPPFPGIEVREAGAPVHRAGGVDAEVMVFVPPGADCGGTACERLAGWAIRSEIGLAAGSLVDRSGIVLEAGALADRAGGVRPLFRNLEPGFEGMGRREILPQNLLVPGFWFLAVRREIWDAASPMATEADSWMRRIAELAIELRGRGLWNVLIPSCRVVAVPPTVPMPECPAREPLACLPETDPFGNPNLTAAPGFFTLEQDRRVRRFWTVPR